MSFLRSVQRAQAWQTSGYVCPSCRHKLRAGRGETFRRQSNYTPFEKNTNLEDWTENPNNLGPADRSIRLREGKHEVEKKSTNASQHASERTATEDGRGLSDSLVESLKKKVQDNTKRMIKEMTGQVQADVEIGRIAESEKSQTGGLRLDAESSSKSTSERIPIPQFAANATSKPAFLGTNFEVESEFTSQAGEDKPEVDATPKPMAMPKFASTTASKPSYSPFIPSHRSSGMLSTTQKVEELSSRPGWGGVTAPVPPRSDDGSSPFLNSLKRPWKNLIGNRSTLNGSGIDTTKATDGFGDSPADLAERASEATAIAQNPKAVATASSRSMASLRHRLNSDLETKSDVQPQPTTSTENAPLLEPSFERPSQPVIRFLSSSNRYEPSAGRKLGAQVQVAALGKNVEYYSRRPNASEEHIEDVNGESTNEAKTDKAYQRLANLHVRQTSSNAETREAGIKRGKVSDVPGTEVEGLVSAAKERIESLVRDKAAVKDEQGSKGGRRRRKLRNTKAAATAAERVPDTQLSKHLSTDSVTKNEPSTTADDRSMATMAQSNAPGGVDSKAQAGGSDDDGEHKPLWEVMGRAEALMQNSTITTETAEVSEQPTKSSKADPPPLESSSDGAVDILSIRPSNLEVTPLRIPQPPVPGLEYGLDRVLFNPGVYQLQDPLSRVYNFDPYLQNIMPVAEFDFNALKEYKTSSQDTMLSGLAKEYGKRYIGSTSSMTGTLGHFHYLLSDWRPVNLSMLSKGFSDKLDTFTLINRAPNAIFLRWKNGTYAIDADKEYDSGNVLMMLGKSMEKLLTMRSSEYERYRKSDPRAVSEEERTAPEAFEYTTMGDFLMRSQLDAYDPRLPGTGMFDLKTRAVISVRMDAEDFKPMTGYEIYTLQGRFGSYEREYYDMIRSTMLKYMLQARMGRMDGIFVAYHNVERIFGFQYVPIQEMDRALHGQLNPCLGDQEFRTSLELLNKVFNKATAKFPEQSLRFHFETTNESLESGSSTTVMWIFAEPVVETEIERIQSTSKAKVAEFERTMMGIEDGANATRPQQSATVQNVNGSNVEPTSTGDRDDCSTTRSEYITSNSSADLSFINSVASSASSSQERKPLFAASIICKSRVNDESVQRPERLKPEDNWEVEYLLREWDAPEAMWARYEQMKARRKDVMEKFRSEDEVEDESGTGELSSKQKRERAFIDFLRSMSTSGREFRSKMDASEAGKTPVVLGQAQDQPSQESGEQIRNVQEYMQWLYAGEKA